MAISVKFGRKTTKFDKKRDILAEVVKFCRKMSNILGNRMNSVKSFQIWQKNEISYKVVKFGKKGEIDIVKFCQKSQNISKIVKFGKTMLNFSNKYHV